MQHLDSDLLRTFLAVTESGSFSEAALRIHRSQSAVSMQIKNLEAVLGQPVFVRHGRGVSLSPSGESLLPVARRTVGMLDSAYAELTGAALRGPLRLGIPEEHGKGTISRIVARFAERHPGVELTVHCSASAGFETAVRKGELDLAVYEVQTVQPTMTLLRAERTCWATSRHHDTHRRTPVPVALFDRDCWWREVALGALDARNQPYRVMYSSESVTGVLSAIEAGIAIGVVQESWLGSELTPLGAAAGSLPCRPRTWSSTGERRTRIRPSTPWHEPFSTRSGCPRSKTTGHSKPENRS